MKRVGLIVPTFNAGEIWSRWLEAFDRQEEKPTNLLVIDSSSDDNTAALAMEHGFKVLTISRKDFSHGGTRQFGVDKLSDVDIIIFITQDAILVGTDAIRNLVRAFDDPTVGAVYGRQIPREGAGAIEAHARYFNYPPKSSMKYRKDVRELGLRSVFISNSFAAYRREMLMAVGGFPKDSVFAEDMYVAAKMRLNGAKIVYCPDAAVFHSHKYRYFEEFRRYFDNGVFHGREPWIQEKYGPAVREGLRYVISELNFLGIRNFHLIPSSIIRNGLKLFAYGLGKKENRLPQSFKKKLSIHSGF
jgi:rhamnosyltransferase